MGHVNWPPKAEDKNFPFDGLGRGNFSLLLGANKEGSRSYFNWQLSYNPEGNQIWNDTDPVVTEKRNRKNLCS